MYIYRKKNDMENNHNQLGCLIQTLRKIDSSFEKNGISTHALALKNNDSEIVVTGNFEGLINLGLKILEVASSCSDGEHVHFDEHSLFDECDKGLIISYKSAEWD